MGLGKCRVRCNHRFLYDFLPRKGSYFDYDDIYGDCLAKEIDRHHRMYEQCQATFTLTNDIGTNYQGVVATLPMLNPYHFASPMDEANSRNASQKGNGHASTQSNANAYRRLFGGHLGE